MIFDALRRSEKKINPIVLQTEEMLNFVTILFYVDCLINCKEISHKTKKKGERFYCYHSYHHEILNPPPATSVLNYTKLWNCVMSRERNVLLFTVCHHSNWPPSDANEIHVYFIGSTIIFFLSERNAGAISVKKPASENKSQ